MNNEKVDCFEYPIFVLLKQKLRLLVTELDLLALSVARAFAALVYGDVRFLGGIFSEVTVPKLVGFCQNNRLRVRR